MMREDAGCFFWVENIRGHCDCRDDGTISVRGQPNLHLHCFPPTYITAHQNTCPAAWLKAQQERRREGLPFSFHTVSGF